MEKGCDLLSRNLAEEEIWSSFDWIVACLSRYGITTVSVAFGWAWGDWKSEPIELANLRSRVLKAEAQELGSLSTDDLYIQVEGIVQIQYCHHADIHLTLTQDDHPLTRELATYLTETIGLQER